MLSVVAPNILRLDTHPNDIQLNNKLNATLGIMILSITAEHCYAECHMLASFAECHYAECRYAECRGAQYFYTTM
jgi:hypothetical protein